MSKFSRSQTAAPAVSPVTTTVPTQTHQGGPGYALDAKSALFTLAVASMVGEKTFYETVKSRDDRFRALASEVTTADPDWVARFVPFLRGDMNMRSAALVLALESAHTRLTTDCAPATIGVKRLVESALQRPDEPAEALGYWLSEFGRNIPMPVKRAINRAATRLYTEYAAHKFDPQDNAVRMGDVIRLCHPVPRAQWQSDLFTYLQDRRHGRPDARVTPLLTKLTARQTLMEIPTERRREFLTADPVGAAQQLRDAGFTWESLSEWIGGPLTAPVWEAIIPSMGYMALLRNLRNFDKAGVSDLVAAKVGARLADPAEVARSRQFPFRLFTAYREAPSLRWSWPLEQALDASVTNIAGLPGRTLILVDTSGSMDCPISDRSSVARWDLAALCGIVVARRCEDATLVSFSAPRVGRPGHRVFNTDPAGSVLNQMACWRAEGYNLGWGTYTQAATRATYAGHHRVVVLTDDQSMDGDPGDVVPRRVPVYTWDLAGHGVVASRAGDPFRHVFAGFSDAAFRQLPLLEMGRSADWPF